MKKKTYKNMVKAVNLIMSKGYTKEESNEIAINIFDNFVGPDTLGAEFFIDKIRNKNE